MKNVSAVNGTEASWLIAQDEIRLKDSHSAAADAAGWADKQDQAKGNHHQKAQCKRRQRDIDVDVIAPAGTAVLNCSRGLMFTQFDRAKRFNLIRHILRFVHG